MRNIDKFLINGAVKCLSKCVVSTDLPWILNELTKLRIKKNESFVGKLVIKFCMRKRRRNEGGRKDLIKKIENEAKDKMFKVEKNGFTY